MLFFIPTSSALLVTLTGLVALATVYDVSERISEWYYSDEAEKFESSEILEAKSEIAGANVVNQHKKKGKPWVKGKRTVLGQFIIDCSFYTNSEKFFRTDNGGKISCLNGIRTYSMIWIIFSHT